MKRFLLFAGATYYPCGGWCDFQGAFDTFAAAETAARELRRTIFVHWAHVVDSFDECATPIRIEKSEGEDV